MKKNYILITLIFIFGLFLTACGKKDNNQNENSNVPDIVCNGKNYSNTNTNYVDGTDMQYMFATYQQHSPLAKSDTGYYVHDGNFLYFSGKDNINFIPLCAKPECPHRDSNCNGFIGETTLGSGNIIYNDGYIYALASTDIESDIYEYLWKISKDGTSKEKIDLGNCNTMPEIHRGYIYYSVETTDLETDESLTVKNLLYKKSLDGKDSELIYQSSSPIVNILLFDDYLYFESSGDYFYKNINNDDECQLMTPPDNCKYLVGLFFYNNKLLFSSYDVDNNWMVYSANLDYSNVKKEIDMTGKSNLIGSDGYFIYEDNYMNKETRGENPKDRKLVIYDGDFNKIDEVGLGQSGTFLNGYGDDKYFFVTMGNEMYYFEKSQIGTGKIETKTFQFNH